MNTGVETANRLDGSGVLGMTLDSFVKVEYPKNQAIVTLVDYNEQTGEIAIGFPSWHDPNKTNETHYFIGDKSRDFCKCTGAGKFKVRCWHLKYRPVILKMFLNQRDDYKRNAVFAPLTTLEELKKVNKIVLALLEQDERCRNDDKWLTYRVMRQFIKIFIDFRDFTKIPAFETVKRTRAYIQNVEGKFLPTDPKVLLKRGHREDTMRGVMKNNGEPLPDKLEGLE